MSCISRPSAWASLLIALSASPLRAQGWREAQVWGVAVASDPAAYAGGIGLSLRDARRTRVAVALATGVSNDGDAGGRFEAAWSFLLDPARVRGAALYGGGGLALSIREHDRLRPWLLLHVGMEWNPAGARGLFVEAGAGGGARFAAGIRMRKRNAPARQGRGVP